MGCGKGMKRSETNLEESISNYRKIGAGRYRTGISSMGFAFRKRMGNENIGSRL